MSAWNTDISAAPKGQHVERIMVTKDGPKPFQSYEPDHVILMSKCGKVIKSYWLPKDARWAGLASTEQPLAWQPWPEWDEGIAAHALSLPEPAQ